MCHSPLTRLPTGPEFPVSSTFESPSKSKCRVPHEHWYDFLNPDSYLEVKFPKALTYCSSVTTKSFGKRYGIHQLKSLMVDRLRLKCPVDAEINHNSEKQHATIIVAISFRTRRLNMASMQFHSLFEQLICASSFHDNLPE